MLDWTVPQEWNIAGCLDRGPGRPARRRLRRLDRCTCSATASRCGSGCRSTSSKQHLYSLPEHPDWIPFRNSYYQPELGLLPPAPAACESLPDGRVRGLHRLDARGRLAHLRRGLRARRERGRGARLRLRRPSVDGERQPLRPGADGAPRPRARRALAALLLPLPLQPRDDRPDRLARPQRGAPRARQARARLPLRRRRGPAHLQAEPSRHRGDRPCGAARAPRLGRAVRGARVGAVGRRRAAVQLARASTSRSGRSRARRPGSFPEYHTSADDLDFVRPEALVRSFQAYMYVFDVLETNETYVNLSPRASRSWGAAASTGAIGADPARACASSRCSGC